MWLEPSVPDFSSASWKASTFARASSGVKGQLRADGDVLFILGPVEPREAHLALGGGKRPLEVRPCDAEAGSADLPVEDSAEVRHELRDAVGELQGSRAVAPDRQPAVDADAGREQSERKAKEDDLSHGGSFARTISESVQNCQLRLRDCGSGGWKPAARGGHSSYELAILRLYQFFALRLVSCSSRWAQ